MIVYLHNISSYSQENRFFQQCWSLLCICIATTCWLSDFDKQIQEKHIHNWPNLSNLLTAHSQRHAYIESHNKRLKSHFSGTQTHYITVVHIQFSRLCNTRNHRELSPFCVEVNATYQQKKKTTSVFSKSTGSVCDGMTSGSEAQGLRPTKFNMFCETSCSLDKGRKQSEVVD